MKLDVIYNKSCQRMTELLDECIDMCLSSPPYWGLRDYGEDVKEIWGGDKDCEHNFETERTPRPNASGGKDNPFAEKLKIKGVENYSEFADYHDRATYSQFCVKCGAWHGQLGLEPTFQLYLDHMMIVCAEIKRVLKKTGSFWLNYGDSYNGASCGTSDKEPEDSLMRDCLCENLCGECRKAYLIGKFRNGNLLFPKQSASLSEPSRGHKESANDHFPTSDSSRQDYRNVNATQDSKHSLIHEAEPLPVSLKSKNGEFSQQPLGGYLQKDTNVSCPLCGRTSVLCVQGCGHKKVCTSYTGKQSGASNHHKLGNAFSDLAYPYSTITSRNVKLPAKCLLGIPWRLILRLIDEQNWILRNAIIWSKPNAMPSSVKDRCSNSYEHLFHLVKAKKYYYDLDAIREEHKDSTIQRAKYHWCKRDTKASGYQKLSGLNRDEPYPLDSRGKNPGDVWLIPTQPRPEAHFATFPDKLCIKPILATCPAEICKKCGKARVRITKTNYEVLRRSRIQDQPKQKQIKEHGQQPYGFKVGAVCNAEHQTTGWTDCGCNAGWDSGVLLDPFAGRGTSLIMAKKLGRHYVGYELKKEYWEMAERELEEIDPLFRRR